MYLDVVWMVSMIYVYNITLLKIKDDNGEVRTYIICASVSGMLSDLNQLIVYV